MGDAGVLEQEARLTLPPLLRHVAPPPGSDPLRAAAESGEDAGALFWAPEPRLLRLAVTLEPEGPPAEAARAFFVCMAALGDALAFHCPPERLVAFGWPDVVLFDAARLGGCRLWRDDAGAGRLVFAASLHRDRQLDEPGRFPHSTALVEEAFDSAPEIVESFARHLCLWADRWAHEGFAPVARAYLDRLADGGPGAALSPAGDLVAPGAEPRRLAAGLAAAAWAGPDGEPRL